MNRVRTFGLALLIGAITFSSIGCGGGGPDDKPDMGQVTGTITMDGKPLADATVTFIPEKGRPAFGKTDAEGKYELTYIRQEKGCKIGPNKVSVTTAVEADESGDEGEAKKKAPERVAVKFNKKTTLTADVKKGPNTFDFAVEAKK